MIMLARILMLAAAAVISGCPPQGEVMPKPVAAVVGMEMQVNLYALNWDGRPGPDGLEVRVRLYIPDPVRAVPVSGTLEFLLFEGRIPPERIEQTKPLRTWSFVGEPLQRHARPGPVGWHYMLRLDWGLDVPTSNSVTLISRYKLPDGRWLYSSPNSSIMISSG